MLIAAGRTTPKIVDDQLRSGEVPGAVLAGLSESGMAVTQERLFAWRAGGAVSPMPLAAIERILVDVGNGSAHLQIVVVPTSSVHPPLVLLCRGGTLPGVMTFIAQLVAAAPREALREQWGPVVRFTFPAGLTRED
jgi:hypothetical protein